MAGTIFSGWYGRRSSRPYFDELPRIAASEYKHLAPGLLIVTAAGQSYSVQLVRVPSGCMTAPRLICAHCSKACRVLYGLGAARCHICTPALYRTHSESPMRRAVRAAFNVWRQCKIDYKRPARKPRWQRWPTYARLSAAAEEVFPIIDRAENAPYDAIQRMMTDMKPKKRGRCRSPPSPWSLQRLPRGRMFGGT
jgi:hypothetical protein